MTARWRRALAPIGAALALATCFARGPLDLGRPERVADGVELYRLTDVPLLEPPGRSAIHLLRLDPAKVDLRSALANDEVMGTETVLDTALRHRAIAAINAGFFLPNGDPVGLLKLGGRLVSDMRSARGAVAIVRSAPPSRVRLLFDRVTVTMTLGVDLDGQRLDVPLAGVDTTRIRGKLMLYTPLYHADTDTAAGGTEWVLDGERLKVTARHDGVGRTPIPRSGAVLSYGGTELPAPLDRLASGTEVAIRSRFDTSLGTASSDWADAADIVSGAGLLVTNGRPLTEWDAENLSPDFATKRHPRTMIGVDDRGAIWLVTVDGRQPEISDGMNFAELQRLAAALRLREALNLDGGGSTTMVVNGRIVNRPSDKTGPRKVGDALLVMAR